MPERSGSTPAGADDLSVELARRIQGGDATAWEALYRRYHDALLFSVRARLGPRLRARLESEDVLQSVLEDALRDLARFEPRGPGSLRHWLHACVLNKIRARADYHAAGLRASERSAGSELVELPGDAAPLDYLEAERYGRLERALGLLPAEMREVVILRAVEELSTAEAAEVLKKSPEATSKLYNRALARLGGMVAPEERP